MATDPPNDLPPSETDIHAYADGVLTAERSERLRHYLGNRSDEARRVVFYSRLNERLKRAFQPADEPVTPRAIRVQGWRTALKRLLAPNACGIALRTFIALAFAFVALSGWIVALQASDQALSNVAVMVLARASSSDHDATPPEQVADIDHAAPDLAPAGLRVLRMRPYTAFFSASVLASVELAWIIQCAARRCGSSSLGQTS